MNENLLIWILVVTIGVYIYKKFFEKNIGKKKEIKRKSEFAINDIPSGYEVYEDDTFFVHGVKHRFNDCLKWAKGDNCQIYFKRENNNKYDSNAIAVYGKSSTGERKLGYIAAEIADDLVYNELDDKIKARLIGVEIKETPFIEYEILVKKASD